MAAPTDLEQLKRDLSDDKVQLFDVREENEWNDGHLAQASFVPLSEIEEGVVNEERLLASLDKSKKTFVHCRSGVRVLTAAPLLSKMGFAEVVALPEGYNALIAAGFAKG
ncbi:MAG: rhodanese-like domain-containing protein [Deltaproteobacteria bacterium]|nr:rhodanese-like domain-containing protein [Deltaproteobacteria bacterium]